jgi:hypothetical protein
MATPPDAPTEVPIEIYVDADACPVKASSGNRPVRYFCC